MAKSSGLNTPFTDAACPTPKAFRAVTEATPFSQGAPTPDALGAVKAINVGQAPGKVNFKAIPGSQKE